MKHKHRKRWHLGGLALLSLGAAAFTATQAPARDTDVFQVAPKSNAYLLVDRSGSMHYWVYDHSIDWAALYDNFMTRNDLSIAEVRAKFPDKKKNLEGGSGTSSQWVGQYIFDNYSQADGGGFRGYDIIANGPDDQHGLHYEKDRIYLVKWNIEVKIVNGVANTGDMPKSATGHRVKHWDKRVAQKTGNWEDALIALDMKARLDENNNIVFEPGSPLSKDANGHILLNGKVLPLGQDLPEHKYIPLQNGAKLDNGFVGYLQSPGFVNSGYKSVPDGVGPYFGKASDKSLAATDKAREMLLADKATMKTWNLQQWQAWADARFTADNSSDGTTWRDWTKAQTKWKSNNSVFWNWKADELNQPAVNWDASDWRLFIDHIDYDYQSSDKYFCVILPNGKGGQQRGTFLLGRWAQAMYEKNLPEKQEWQRLSGAWEEETDGHNWLYAFVTGNYLNYVQAMTLRYIKSPDLEGKTLQYPYPEAHNEANKDKHGGAVYRLGYIANQLNLSEMDDNPEYIPDPEPSFDTYYVEDGKLKTKSSPRYASNNPLFYEGWPDRGGKRLQNRFQALRDALVHTLDNYGDKMNWGFGAYPRKQPRNDTGYIHGVTDQDYNKPEPPWLDEQGKPRSTLLDLTRNPAALLRDVREKASLTGAKGGTPMTGALQHIWYYGFHKPYTEGKLGREEDCGKYYIITLADGMASVDYNHSKQGECFGENFGYGGNCQANKPIIPLDAPIHPNYNGRRPPSYAKPFNSPECNAEALGRSAGKSWDTLQGFQNWDCDYWRNDASQGDGGTVATLYDDVSEYMYTHSFKDGEEICNPRDADAGKAAECRQKLKDSLENVKSHHISFGLVVPAMRDAADSAGGRYFVASNKEQLIAVFETLAQSMSETSSFAAPTPSTNSENKMESGNDMYMGLFLPRREMPWVGNVKKFQYGRCGAGGTRTVCDKNGVRAVDASGNILSSAPDLWDTGDSTIANPIGDAIAQDGVGEVLLRDVKALFAEGDYWKRPIYTAMREDKDDDEEDDDDEGAKWTKVAFTQSIDPEKLGLSEAAARDALVNYVHGYTREANEADGSPLAVRDWIMGPVLHAQPITLDYFDTSQRHLPLKHRYVAVGSSSGLLHIFDDATGKEVFSFIPPEMLKKLKDTDQLGVPPDMLDGTITVYRGSRSDDPTKVNSNPKYLIFGERRGGNRYWCLDVSDGDNPRNWTIKWSYRHEELGQTWSEVNAVRVLLNVTASSGSREYRDALVFSGGYDPVEDDFPEPFSNNDGKGSVFCDADDVERDRNTSGARCEQVGDLNPARWDPTKRDINGNLAHDVNGNGKYDLYNPEKNTMGRGIFIVDVENPYLESKIPLNGETVQLLPFSVTYGDKEEMDKADGEYKRPDMKYSFPASPSVVTRVDEYAVRGLDATTGRMVTRGYRMPIVMNTLYAADIYANIFRVRFDLNAVNTSPNAQRPNWELQGKGWVVDRIFSANPGSEYAKAGERGALIETDRARKSFHSPTVSWGGTTDYFTAQNFRRLQDGTTFSGREGMMTLVFGTGDREHPTYTMVSNRLYSIYDDTTLKAVSAGGQEFPVSTAPYTERNLMNLTCDELGLASMITDCYLDGVDCGSTAYSRHVAMQSRLRGLLIDDPVDGNGALESSTGEDDFKGWFIMLDRQADPSLCRDHMEYKATIDAEKRGNHKGEAVLTKPVMFYGVLYATAYQPPGSNDDSCAICGNGFFYGIDYDTAGASYNRVNAGATDISDRYSHWPCISGLPSSPSITISGGVVYARASMGGKTVGGGFTPGTFLTNDGFRNNQQAGAAGGAEAVAALKQGAGALETTPEGKSQKDPGELGKGPGSGVQLYYWRDSNSQRQPTESD